MISVLLNSTLRISSASIGSGFLRDTNSAGQRSVSGNSPQAKSSNVFSRVERRKMEISNFPTSRNKKIAHEFVTGTLFNFKFNQTLTKAIYLSSLKRITVKQGSERAL